MKKKIVLTSSLLAMLSSFDINAMNKKERLQQRLMPGRVEQVVGSITERKFDDFKQAVSSYTGDLEAFKEYVRGKLNSDFKNEMIAPNFNVKEMLSEIIELLKVYQLSEVSYKEEVRKADIKLGALNVDNWAGLSEDLTTGSKLTLAKFISGADVANVDEFFNDAAIQGRVVALLKEVKATVDGQALVNGEHSCITEANLRDAADRIKANP